LSVFGTLELTGRAEQGDCGHIDTGDGFRFTTAYSLSRNGEVHYEVTFLGKNRQVACGRLSYVTDLWLSFSDFEGLARLNH